MCRTGKYDENLANPEPALIGYHRPERKSRTKNTMDTTGPAASWLGIKVLVAMPSAVKHRPPTTKVTTRAAMLWGSTTWYPNRPISSKMTTWTAEMSKALQKMALNRTHVGSGERRMRFNSPISRRTTREIVNMLKQADMTP